MGFVESSPFFLTTSNIKNKIAPIKYMAFLPAPKASVLKATNVKRAFSHKPGPEHICARLGEIRNQPSVLTYQNSKLSISAHVRKADSRDQCQDSALVFVSDDIIAAGVFDGYGRTGTFLSEAVPDKILEILSAERVDTAKSLLITAVARLVGETTIPPMGYRYGGATAVLVLLSHDLTFSAAVVSDSALFRFSDGRAERFFEYMKPIEVLDLDGEDLTLEVMGMALPEYFFRRNIVSDTIEITGLKEDAVEDVYGKLTLGSGLLLTTDGVTKCLDLISDPVTEVVLDNSGVQDLSEIIGRKRIADSIAYALMTETKRRIYDNAPEEIIMDGDRARCPADDDVAVVAITTA